MSVVLQSQRLQIAGLLTPAYLWLTVAVFLPLSAMLYFSFLSDVPFGERDWHYTFENYRAFFETSTYALLLWKSIKLGLIVTSVSVLIGFPCAYVLAKIVRGKHCFFWSFYPFGPIRWCAFSPGRSCCVAMACWTDR